MFNDLFTDQLDLPQHHFDAITFNDSLEHFADPVPALRYCRELLAPDGIIVCTLPNVRHVANLEHILFEKDWQYMGAGIRDRTHLRFFTKLSMNRLFAESGFETVKQVGINEDWWSAEKRLRRLMFRLFPGFTEDMRYIQYVNVLRPARAPAR
ncbi:MAG: methyltransferase domain-containing protein [Betaproteobacteria bacterium]